MENALGSRRISKVSRHSGRVEWRQRRSIWGRKGRTGRGSEPRRGRIVNQAFTISYFPDLTALYGLAQHCAFCTHLYWRDLQSCAGNSEGPVALLCYCILGLGDETAMCMHHSTYTNTQLVLLCKEICTVKDLYEQDDGENWRQTEIFHLLTVLSVE